jgi:Flp pilus assembly pilin Flp
MGASLVRLFADQSGVTAIEYGVMSFVISLVLIAAAGGVGNHLKSLFHVVAAFDSGASIHTH